jgi:opacity protein-like surface antigen
MQGKFVFGCICALLLVSAAARATGQAVYSAGESRSSISVGGGISGFNPDLGSGFWLGPAVWADYKPAFFHGALGGLAIAAEGRGILWNRSNGQAQDGWYEATVAGGFIYHPGFIRSRRISPYVKALGGLGWNPWFAGWGPPFLVYHFGGGVDYPLSHRVSLRGDYEYQIWTGVPSFAHPGHASTDSPNGFTIGAMYHFGSRE